MGDIQNGKLELGAHVIDFGLEMEAARGGISCIKILPDI